MMPDKLPAYHEFNELTEEQQNYAMFSMVYDIKEHLNAQDTSNQKYQEYCEGRFQALESQKVYYKAISAVTGVLGGFAAVVAYIITKLVATLPGMGQ